MPYNLMSLEEIYNFPINDFADEDSTIFLWTTQKFIHDAFHILEKWGFKYHCVLTWDKNDGMVMFGIRRRTEFVLLGSRSKLKFFTSGKPIESLFYEKLKKNSKKPDIFYQMIIKKYPEPRIDIFARKKHYGFDVWGNETEDPLTLESFN